MDAFFSVVYTIIEHKVILGKKMKLGRKKKSAFDVLNLPPTPCPLLKEKNWLNLIFVLPQATKGMLHSPMHTRSHWKLVG